MARLLPECVRSVVLSTDVAAYSTYGIQGSLYSTSKSFDCSLVLTDQESLTSCYSQLQKASIISVECNLGL